MIEKVRPSDAPSKMRSVFAATLTLSIVFSSAAVAQTDADYTPPSVLKIFSALYPKHELASRGHGAPLSQKFRAHNFYRILDVKGKTPLPDFWIKVLIDRFTEENRKAGWRLIYTKNRNCFLKGNEVEHIDRDCHGITTVYQRGDQILVTNLSYCRSATPECLGCLFLTDTFVDPSKPEFQNPK